MSTDRPAGKPPSNKTLAASGYGAYLRLDRILTAQEPRTAVHDELFFIVIHQAFELWFKVLIHELRALRSLMIAGEAEAATPVLRRITRIQALLVDQIRLIDTLSPVEFLRFRGALGTASGYESQQFRTIEALLGLRPHGEQASSTPAESRTADAGGEGRDAAAEPTLDGALWMCFVARGHLAAALKDDRNTRQAAAAALFQAPRADPALAALCEGLLDIAQGLWLWRATHLGVVDRMIGGRMGTGQTAGVAYLARTLDQKVFPDLSAAHGSLEQP